MMTGGGSACSQDNIDNDILTGCGWNVAWNEGKRKACRGLSMLFCLAKGGSEGQSDIGYRRKPSDAVRLAQTDRWLRI